ncbi:MAG: hypothetical protein QXQ70_08125 [Candidatus Caldarchaeum sp.]
MTGSTGWVPVDLYTLKTEFENVFAVGDVAAVKLKNGMFLPKAGVFAESQGVVVARNIAAEVLGAADIVVFDGRGYCYLDMGDGRAAFASGEFFAEPSPKIKLEPPSERYRFENTV